MLTIFVFSYNRGEYLDNCIRSIERCCPDAEVTVYDDASDDPETLRVLNALENRCRVVRREAGAGSRLGGLYPNMQAAFDSVTDDRVICFLQDDTQMIRTLDAVDHRFIDDYFERFTDAAFLAPVFLRGTISARRLATFEYSGDAGVYAFRETPQIVAGMYFSAVGILHTGRLRRAGWRFLPTEIENEHQAQQHFCKMGYMREPFAMWLPNASAYRFRRKTLAFRLGEHFSKSGFYPLCILDAESVRAMRERNATAEPTVAERFLSLDGRTLKQPWPFSPLKISRLLRRLNELEVWLQQWKTRFLRRAG